MNSVENDKAGYWEGYYASEFLEQVAPPSQFAAFVAQEVEKTPLLVDVGCGSGRDSVFFAQRGFPVLGVDASHAAIERCRDISTRMGLAKTRFECASVDSDAFKDILADAVGGAEQPALVYARFFLHAITDAEQTRLVGAVSSALRKNDFFAIEYRTTRDAQLSKETSRHYRRFIDPAHLIVTIAEAGFTVEYAAEGFGFAKFRKDDAHVARAIFRKE